MKLPVTAKTSTEFAIETEKANAQKTLRAPGSSFGGIELDYTVEVRLNPQWVVQLSVAPVRTELAWAT